MKRLTRKDGEYYRVDRYSIFNYEEESESIIFNLSRKLGKLEDLEEEIGCPLEILFRALEDGFYVDKEQVEKEPAWENNKGLTKIGCPKYFKLNMWYKTIEVDREGQYLEIELSDYKKSWWLKEDRSE